MHASVLLQETIQGLEPKSGQTIVDGTLGNGGHTAAICEQFGHGVRVIALDLDRESIARATQRLSNLGCDVTMREANFRTLDTVLAELGIDGVDGILLDLGWSMDQFTSSGRGFSFRQDEPLSMMLKAEKGEADFDAADIVNGWKEEDIANVIYGYGEERFARRIAREIVEARETAPIMTSGQLAEIALRAVPAFYSIGRTHPATKTFQALRIAVNDELGSLSEVLIKGFHVLKPGGRMAIISFHSLEDRIVKNFFKQRVAEGVAEAITKKPIIAGDEEVAANPRSRSAKLRIIKKI